MGTAVGPGQALTTGEAVLYTAPIARMNSLNAARLEGVLLCNTTGASVTVTLGRVPDGGTLASGNHFVSALPVEPNDTAWYATHLILSSAMKIIGLASATGVNCFLLVLPEENP